MFLLFLLFIGYGKQTIFLDTQQVKQSSFLIDTNQISQDIQSQQNLENYYNYQYVGSIQVLDGKEPYSQFKIIFDTGSTHMWLPSSNCVRCKSYLNGQPMCSQEQAAIQYHVGSLVGQKCIAMFSINEIFTESQFILVDEIFNMEGATYDGVVGLNQQSNHTFIEWPISFYYNFMNSNKKSSITFGGYDQTLVDKEIRYINSDSNWIVASQEININGVIGVDNYALIDSGSSLLVFPKYILDNIRELYQGCQLTDVIKCSCPTNDLTKYPTIKIQLDNSEFTLEPKYYIHTFDHEPYCYILISTLRSHNEKLIVLGSPFMRKYYTIFDKQNSKIGLAELQISNFYTSSSKYMNNIFALIVCLVFAFIVIRIINYFIEFELRKQNNQKSLMV